MSCILLSPLLNLFFLHRVEKALSTIRTSIVPIPNRYPVETILIQPNNGNITTTIPPLITFPHGGPHGTTSTAFSAATIALVLEGCESTEHQKKKKNIYLIDNGILLDTVSLPNYTGSLGFGDGFVQRLVVRGNCGRLDVEDCYASIRHLIESGIAEEGPGKQFVTGGSHGGFLTAHRTSLSTILSNFFFEWRICNITSFFPVIGQYPDFFSAAVMRNPVISPAGVFATDIPDWFFSEFGFEYPLSSSTLPAKADSSLTSRLPPLLSSETYTKLLASLPISHVDSIKIPVLLLIGAADRRVPPDSQGIKLYHALKGRYASTRSEGIDDNRKVEVLVFEGQGHSLDGVEAAKAGFEATRQWLADAGVPKK